MGSDASWKAGEGGKDDFNNQNKSIFKKLYCFAKNWGGGGGGALP